MPELGARLPSVSTVTGPTMIFQLGAWLGGLEAFLENEALATGSVTDFSRPLIVSRGALQRASHLCLALADSLNTSGQIGAVSIASVRSMHAAIRKLLSLCDSLIDARPLTQESWLAWKSTALKSLIESPEYSQFLAAAEEDGTEFLPRKLRNMLSAKLTAEDARMLESVLPRFGTVLRLLDLVGEMLERDEPLKASLVIFSKTAERIRELVAHINQQVRRAGDDVDGMLGVLDGASYMTSIELKKVLQQELFGVVSMRPATMIYARNETAYALLTEGFQQILAQFARHVDPTVDIFDLFPSFKNKLEQSIVLRRELHQLGAKARETENKPDAKQVEQLNAELNRFMEKNVRYLFYKDIETFERFVEEILANKDQKDLTALLHRFAAYVETLFGQVSLRAVLENHSFEQARA